LQPGEGGEITRESAVGSQDVYAKIGGQVEQLTADQSDLSGELREGRIHIKGISGERVGQFIKKKGPT